MRSLSSLYLSAPQGFQHFPEYLLHLYQLTGGSHFVGLTGGPVHWHFARMVADLQIYWAGHLLAQKGVVAGAV